MTDMGSCIKITFHRLSQGRCTAVVGRLILWAFLKFGRTLLSSKIFPNFFPGRLIICCNPTIGSRPILWEEANNESAQYHGGGLEPKARISCHNRTLIVWGINCGFDSQTVNLRVTEKPPSIVRLSKNSKSAFFVRVSN